MANILRALWYRELILYRRHILSSAFLPILMGLVFFFVFSLPFRNIVSEARWMELLHAFTLDTVVLTMVVSIYETTARFYWEAQHGQGMASLYEMGRFSREPSFFFAQAIIGVGKGYFHGLLILVILLLLNTEMSFKISIQASLVFSLLGALQVVSMSKIVGLMLSRSSQLNKMLYLGGIPILLISGLYLAGPSPLQAIAGVAYYFPPYNWISGLNLSFLEGSIDYSFLFISLIETVFLVWVAATFFHLDGDR